MIRSTYAYIHVLQIHVTVRWKFKWEKWSYQHLWAISIGTHTCTCTHTGMYTKKHWNLWLFTLGNHAYNTKFPKTGNLDPKNETSLQSRPFLCWQYPFFQGLKYDTINLNIFTVSQLSQQWNLFHVNCWSKKHRQNPRTGNILMLNDFLQNFLTQNFPDLRYFNT